MGQSIGVASTRGSGTLGGTLGLFDRKDPSNEKTVFLTSRSALQPPDPEASVDTLVIQSPAQADVEAEITHLDENLTTLVHAEKSLHLDKETDESTANAIQRRVKDRRSRLRYCKDHNDESSL